MLTATIKSFSLSALLVGAVAVQSQEDARALLLKGRALQRGGGGDDPAGAVKIFKKVVGLEPTSAEAHLRLSEALLENGNLDSAIESAKQATQLAPKSFEAWAHRGILEQAYSRKHHNTIEDAKQSLKMASSLLSSDPEIWARLAEVSESCRDDDLALTAWVRIGRLRPQYSIQGKMLGDIGWERAVGLAEKLKRYDIRREAIMALCNRPSPESRNLGLLEDLAREQAEKGYLGHAEESFSILGKHLPEVPALWENIALLQLRTSRFEEALKTLLKAEGLRQSPRTSYHIGYCLMNLGRLQEAEARWKDVLNNRNGISQEDQHLLKETIQVLGTAYLLQGRPEELLALLDKEEGVSAKPELMGLKVIGLFQTQKIKPAFDLLKYGIGQFPDKSLFLIAKHLPPRFLDEGLFNQKRIRQTLQQLNFEMMATLNADFRRWDACLDMLKQAKKVEPRRSVEMVLLHGSALQELGQLDRAIDVLREGQAIMPDHPTLQNNLGYLLLEKGEKIQEAAQLIEASLKKDPENGSTMDSWGWALFMMGKFDEAEKALRKAAELSPFSPETRKHLGEVLLKLDKPEEALEQWERALAFVFADRKDLEEKVRLLKVRIAKRKQESQTEDIPEVMDEEDYSE